MVILRSLAFNIHIELPYVFLINYLKLLNLEQEELYQIGWSYLNDGLRTKIYALFEHPNNRKFDKETFEARSDEIVQPILKASYPSRSLDGRQIRWPVARV